MTSPTMPALHIPDGINYDCSGCGKCCGGWAVPMTTADYERIRYTDWGALLPKLSGKKLFRPLKGYEKKGTQYTHAIIEAENGYCPFLQNNLCFIHGQFQSETKPSMCQLFPYCFNETPSGIYASVSFVSMAVVHNSGTPLSKQRELLEKKLADFQALFPDHHPNWAKLELTGGHPISWSQYLTIEQEILSRWNQRQLPMEDRFRQVSKDLIARVKEPSAEKSPQADSNETAPKPLKPLDNHLLMSLHAMYFPTKILARGEGDFSIMRFLTQMAFKGISAPLSIKVPGQSFGLEQLSQIKWPDSDPEIEDLLYRYFFSRIFSKLYFGAGFGQLSLIAGFHHLTLLYTLTKLQAKALALSRDVQKVSYIDVVAAVRQLEKRLGETAVSGYGAAAFELLLFSPARIDRILAAA